MFKNLVFCLLLTIIYYSPIFSQSDSIFNLPELIIQHRKGNKTDSYIFNQNNKTKFILRDSILTADPNLYRYSVKINKINKISFRNGSYFWTGAGIGGGVGVLLGVWFWGNFRIDGPSHFRFNEQVLGAALVTSLPFALVGGLVGLIVPKYEDFNVYRVLDKNKRYYIKKIFIMHSSN